MELSPMVVWLVALVLLLQVAEFALRAGRAMLRRVGRTAEPDQRARFMAMSPLEKIETFRLDQLDDDAQQFFLAAVELPESERRRITALLRLGWNGGRAHVAPAPAPPAPGPSAGAADATGREAPSAEVVTLPLKSAQPRSGAAGLAGSERR